MIHIIWPIFYVSTFIPNKSLGRTRWCRYHGKSRTSTPHAFRVVWQTRPTALGSLAFNSARHDVSEHTTLNSNRQQFFQILENKRPTAVRTPNSNPGALKKNPVALRKALETQI